MAKLYEKISRIISHQISMMLEPIIGYSRVVSVTKASLLGIAFVLAAILVILPFYNSVHKNFRITFSSITKDSESNQPVMQNPHLQGVDSNGHTYNITAKNAIQNKGDMITLKGINADINLKDDAWISLSADEGLFDHSKNTMDLKGSINIINNEGYEFSTSEAFADMQNNTIAGDTPIEGQGPIGTIRADKFTVSNKGNTILLYGNVKLIIFSGASSGNN